MPDVVKSRFAVLLKSDQVHAEQGVLSTDESTERRRWHMIVKGVLPEVAEADLAFQELWDHFSRPESWRCYPDVAPLLAALAERGISICVGSNFDGRLRGVIKGLPELQQRANSLVISSEVGFRKPHPSFFRGLHAPWSATCQRLVRGRRPGKRYPRRDQGRPVSRLAPTERRRRGRFTACAGLDDLARWEVDRIMKFDRHV